MTRLINQRHGMWLVFICSILLTLACDAVVGFGGSGQATLAPTRPAANPTATPTPLLQGGDASEWIEPPQPDACPDGPANFDLLANHHFWTDTGMGDWVWQAQGSLQVVLDENGVVTNTATQVIPGSQSGQFSSGQNACSFEAPAEVILTVEGACAGGVLSLEIWEDWQMGTYKWVCDDDSFQFELPELGMPPSVHKVAYNLGQAQSYAFEIPFGGGGGSKVYTLVP